MSARTRFVVFFWFGVREAHVCMCVCVLQVVLCVFLCLVGWGGGGR